MLTHLEPQDPKNWEKMGRAHWRGGCSAAGGCSPSLLRRGENAVRQGHGQRRAPGRNRRCAPCRRLTPGSPPTDSVSTEAPVIYGVLCLHVLAMFKNIVFYGVSGPSAARDFILGMLQDAGFLRGFGLQEGARGRKIGILRSFQHRWPKHGPNIAPKMAQHGPT